MSILHLFIAFVEGLALIASPCILPILPLVLASSIDSGKSRPLGVITGFVISFSILSLLAREFIVILGINLDYIKDVSLVLLVIFGIVLIFEPLFQLMARITQPLANSGLRLSQTNNSGYLGGVMIGALIGFVWTPCAGPILAAALVDIIRQHTQLQAVLTVIIFACGVGLPMFIIAYTGRKLVNSFNVLIKHSHIVHKIIGVIIIANAILIGTGLDSALLTKQISITPNKAITGNQLHNGLLSPYKAPDFSLNDIWLNTKDDLPLTISQLRGKVVLIDFWTYSCINCLRTLPIDISWYNKYHKYGLEIIGVHSPEFEFEKNLTNIKQAISSLHIPYPVAVDNNLDTWTNYNNQYWPASYLIDKNGNVVYTSFGEGDYNITENNIRFLLGLNVESNLNNKPPEFNYNQTPETYLGYQRASSFASNEQMNNDSVQKYTLPTNLSDNSWALSGKWLIGPQNIISTANSDKLVLHFNAKFVYLVLGTPDGQPVNVKILLDGKPISNNVAGSDVHNAIVNVNSYRLYNLVHENHFSSDILEIMPLSKGLMAYVFTLSLIHI
jgi:cytochrome c biogenesis protein CcdA/thiol-disulfide isomerase/thioredoxin